MTAPRTVRAPAKLNLALFLGGARDDGLHEICSLITALDLADELVVSGSGSGADEVVCPGVVGSNLAAEALAALREAGWDGPPLRVEITKRIPIAAGLGGGSADAAAVLRLAADEIDGVEAIAARLGADVTSQLAPGCALVRGAGEIVEPLPDPAPFGVVLLPFGEGLSAAEVYAEADRLAIGRGPAELERLAGELRGGVVPGHSPTGYLALVRNDLEEAALSLRPEIGDALAALRGAGAEIALVTGSGPTAVGLFADPMAAEAAANGLRDRYEAAIATAAAPRMGAA